ncbi:MAG: transposase [Bacteroidales bacterium]|nr:transposase [Bacteroidales bacterium]
MADSYRITDQSGLYFVTLTVVEWVDVFTRMNYKELIINNLKYCQENKGLEIYAYVIMTNHIHLIVRSNTNNLSGTLRDFKSYTSKELLKLVSIPEESRQEWMLRIFSNAAYKHKRNSVFQLWSHNNHPELLWSNEFIEEKVDYIHQNPVRTGIVLHPEEYLFSSAKNYAEENGLLDVILITKKWKTI